MFLEASLKNIETLKWLLLGYEDISGMKINFHKCELVPLNLSEDESNTLATQLGCKLSQLPMIFLGMPPHWKNYQLNIEISQY
jgi:hypothetical protein